jgi:hypothetical protein
LYNLAKVYTDVDEREKSLEICLERLNHCKRTEDLFLFAEFQYQVGRNYLLLGNSKRGLEYWDNAKSIFDCEGKENFADLINKEIDQYKKTNVII